MRILMDMGKHYTDSVAAGRIPRVIEAAPSADPIRADVLKVSKDGKRIRVQFWGRGLMAGKLRTMWDSASSWRPL